VRRELIAALANAAAWLLAARAQQAAMPAIGFDEHESIELHNRACTVAGRSFRC